MKGIMAVAATGVLAFAWFAHASPAAADARHVKHPHGRAVVSSYRRPHVERPPGYSAGGPNYTTCDRINRDRMLVGTCR